MTASGQARADAVSDLLNLKRRGIDRLAQRWQDRLTLNGGDEYTPTQQSNADARCDAEQLTQFVDELALEYGTALPEAFGATVRGLDSIASFERSEFRTLYEKAVYSAQDAFRAVPGLRGEDKSEYKRAD